MNTLPTKKAQQGFTLIELMIVVAIIGILASIAIPAYRDYVTKANVAALVADLAGQKTKLSETYLTLVSGGERTRKSGGQRRRNKIEYFGQ